MKIRMLASAGALVLLAGAFVIVGQGCKGGGGGSVSKAALKTEKEKVSYIIGHSFGQNMRQNGAQDEIDVDMVARGMRAGMAEEKAVFDEQEAGEIMRQFQQGLMTRQQEKAKKDGEENKVKGEKFLAENKGKPGVKTLPSGLQYQVITEGTGKSPKPTDTVSVHYRGTLIDGTEFDSSIARKEPATFQVNGVIPGWQEALPLMKTGAKWKLFVPSAMAYGEAGSGPKIGPNSVLLFEVELLSIQDAAKPQPTR